MVTPRAARSVGVLALTLSCAAIGCRDPAPPPAAEAPPPAAETPPPAAAPAIEIEAVDGARRAWTEAALDAALGAARTTIEVHNPAYGQRLRYEGFWLADVLAATAPAGQWTGTLTFHCADGFTPTLPAERVEPLKLFLAVGQPDLPGGARWMPYKGASPAPFYVVGATPGSYDQLPWPFQLTAIRAVDFRRTWPDAYPADAAPDSPVMRGFERFRTTCFGCHSINLQGGTIGPELNVPVSVLEYWDRAMLERFLADPKSVRARSKMPPLELKPADIAELLAYLEHMRGHKKPVSPPPH